MSECKYNINRFKICRAIKFKTMVNKKGCSSIKQINIQFHFITFRRVNILGKTSE